MQKYAVIVNKDKQESAWIILSLIFCFETTVWVDLFIIIYAYLRGKESEETSEEAEYRL